VLIFALIFMTFDRYLLTTSAEEVAHILSRFGVMRQILTDQVLYSGIN